MDKLNKEEVGKAFVSYLNTKDRRRLGQYLMDLFLPDTSDDGIFYNESPNESFKLFWEKYVE